MTVQWYPGVHIASPRSLVSLVSISEENPFLSAYVGKRISNQLDKLTTEAIMGNAKPIPFDLNSQQIPTTNTIMSTEEKHDMTALAELLVEIDRKIAQHGGRFGSEVVCQKHFRGVTYSDGLVPMDEDGFSKGETLKPYGMTVTDAGRIRFLMEVTATDMLYRYVDLSLDQLEDSFPSVASSIRSIQVGASWSLTSLVWDTQERMRNKPALIALVKDYLKNGRALISELKAGQDEEDAAGFYAKQTDYGSF